MGKGNKDGKNKGGNNKGGAMGITATLSISPEQIRKDNKPFSTHIGEAALTAATSLVTAGAMWILADVGKRFSVALGKLFGRTPDPVAPARQVTSSDGKPSRDDVIAAFNVADEALDAPAEHSALVAHILEAHPEWADHDGMVKGIVGGQLKGNN